MTDDEFTNQNFMLDVGGGHKLHVVDWGNKKAEAPFIYLHGGPGSHVKDKSKAIFNPKVQRVIFFDQRGCGESTPAGSRKNNTTADLAEDITKIAEHLKIDKFNLYGYSWGSTLALYYTINYPDRVKNTVVGGVFLGNNDFPEMLQRVKIFYPEAYAEILAATPAEQQKDITGYHIEKALNGTKAEQKRSAYTLDLLERALASYNYDLSVPENYADYDPAAKQIEISYISNNCFMPKDYLLRQAHKIKTPLYIVQGRADMVCPPAAAYALKKVTPQAKLFWGVSNHAPEHEILALMKEICELIG